MEGGKKNSNPNFFRCLEKKDAIIITGKKWVEGLGVRNRNKNRTLKLMMMMIILQTIVHKFWGQSNIYDQYITLVIIDLSQNFDIYHIYHILIYTILVYRISKNLGEGAKKGGKTTGGGKIFVCRRMGKGIEDAWNPPIKTHGFWVLNGWSIKPCSQSLHNVSHDSIMRASDMRGQAWGGEGDEPIANTHNSIGLRWMKMQAHTLSLMWLLVE